MRIYLQISKIFQSGVVDDALLYYAHQSPKVLLQELKASAFSLSLKPGKTEFVKYGTAPKVESALCKIEINGAEVNEGRGYEYLGVYMNSQLNLHYQFDRLVKCISSRIRLLAIIRPLITPVAADRFYKSMINPIFHYCYLSYVSLSSTKSNKLNPLQD